MASCTLGLTMRVLSVLFIMVWLGQVAWICAGQQVDVHVAFLLPVNSHVTVKLAGEVSILM
jgi:hypothetical protein